MGDSVTCSFNEPRATNSAIDPKAMDRGERADRADRIDALCKKSKNANRSKYPSRYLFPSKIQAQFWAQEQTSSFCTFRGFAGSSLISMV